MPLASTAYSRPLDPRFAPLATRETLGAHPAARRRALATEIAAALGDKFSAETELVGAAELPCVVHRRTSMRFVGIPGGEFVMGMLAAEIDDVVALYAPLGRADEVKSAVTWSTQPLRRVAVRPFLCALQSVTDCIAHALCADIHHGDEEEYAPTDHVIPLLPRLAAELRGALGFRLIAEAEWEWIAREGGARSFLAERPNAVSLELDPALALAPHPNAFGIDLYHAGLEFVADAWHKGYEGAPSTAIAWEPRAVPDHARGCHGSWQDEIEAIRLCAGAREGRHGDDEAAVRFAIDLPSPPPHPLVTA